MTLLRIPRLELIENPNNKNDFIIFRHQIHSKKVPKDSPGSATFSKSHKLSSKRPRKSKKHKTRKHKKTKSIFNLF